MPKVSQEAEDDERDDTLAAITLRLPDVQLRQLKYRAIERSTSVTAIIRSLIEKELEPKPDREAKK